MRANYRAAQAVSRKLVGGSFYCLPCSNSDRMLAFQSPRVRLTQADFDWRFSHMPLKGEYEPSSLDRTREQVELFEKTNGVEGGTKRRMRNRSLS